MRYGNPAEIFPDIPTLGIDTIPVAVIMDIDHQFPDADIIPGISGGFIRFNPDEIPEDFIVLRVFQTLSLIGRTGENIGGIVFHAG
jgi:hypothetical protein